MINIGKRNAEEDDDNIKHHDGRLRCHIFCFGRVEFARFDDLKDNACKRLYKYVSLEAPPGYRVSAKIEFIFYLYNS